MGEWYNPIITLSHNKELQNHSNILKQMDIFKESVCSDSNAARQWEESGETAGWKSLFQYNPPYEKHGRFGKSAIFNCDFSFGISVVLKFCDSWEYSCITCMFEKNEQEENLFFSNEEELQIALCKLFFIVNGVEQEKTIEQEQAEVKEELMEKWDGSIIELCYNEGMNRKVREQLDVFRNEVKSDAVASWVFSLYSELSGYRSPSKENGEAAVFDWDFPALKAFLTVSFCPDFEESSITYVEKDGIIETFLLRNIHELKLILWDLFTKLREREVNLVLSK